MIFFRIAIVIMQNHRLKRRLELRTNGFIPIVTRKVFSSGSKNELEISSSVDMTCGILIVEFLEIVILKTRPSQMMDWRWS